MLIKYDSLNKVLVFIIKGEVKQAGSLYPVINPGRLYDPKPWYTITKSSWMKIPIDESTLLEKLLSLKVFKYLEVTPKGNDIIIDIRRDPFGQKHIQFYGYYPRYFWKGLSKALELR